MTESPHQVEYRPPDQLQPHPYALFVPPLTADEYAALKELIAARGRIIDSVLVDEGGLILDGVHRVRVAAELGLEVPVVPLGHATDAEKLRQAVGKNTRRRQ